MRKTCSCTSLFQKNSKVFGLPLSSNSLYNLVRKSKITGAPAESVDIYSFMHRSLSDPFVPTHRRKREGSVLSRSSTLVRSH
ncbi:hypothetical protein pdam_00006851 [Pocillopora damicornis]|uniref:Uncharacterized protein n=1 Tax=Pocillopora damicornis TaxID=46731 RepID=A0A3M6TP50_POCDA|nr:hypothetical protein pdam_00006851 [Pocillopora damicornis]